MNAHEAPWPREKEDQVCFYNWEGCFMGDLGASWVRALEARIKGRERDFSAYFELGGRERYSRRAEKYAEKSRSRPLRRAASMPEDTRPPAPPHSV